MKPYADYTAGGAMPACRPLLASGSIAKLAKPFTTKGTLRLHSEQAPVHEGETRTLNPSGSSVGE